MRISRPSHSRRARAAAVVGAALAAVLTLAGCQDSSSGAASTPPSLTANATPGTGSPTATPSTTPVTTPAASPSQTPTPTRTSAKPHTPAPAPTKSRTPKPPAPGGNPTTKPTSATHSGSCEIVSNAGNCYNAGQFCRKADLGRSTHAANGRMIYCRIVSGRPHWQY
ncbi:hypothetical protein [Streptomyces melanogenes]|uniref:hypothetical protein n=1 Tax=Streptomyces melanogenes TaxID=67326 RepID=UPI0037A18E45